MDNRTIKCGIKKQKGIATILIVLMISLAMIAVSLGMIYSMRANQELQVAAHASTNSQAGAWAAAEIFRKYLYKVYEDPTVMAGLSGELPIQSSALPSGFQLKANILEVIEPAGTGTSDHYQIRAQIEARDTLAKSATVLEVEYQVFPNCSSGELGSVLDFYRDLDVNGGVGVITDRGQESDGTFSVQGKLSFNSTSATGFNTVRATKNIEVTNDVVFKNLRSNQDIILIAGAVAENAYAVGSIKVQSAVITGDAKANVGITIENGGKIENSYTLGDVLNKSSGWGNTEEYTTDIPQDSGRYINAQGNVTITGAGTPTIEARGTVSIKGWPGRLKTIKSGDSINCEFPFNDTIETMVAAGNITGCDRIAEEKIHENQSVDIDVMTEVQPFSMEAIKVDAWSLKDSANYRFFKDDDGNVKVYIKNINSIDDGEYFIGATYINYSINHGYICAQLSDTTQRICEEPLKKICNGFSDQNRCFEIRTASETQENYEENAPDILRINGKNIAPGVVWFDGTIDLAAGHYHNTFIATANIATASNHITEALNFSGYDNVCENAFEAEQQEQQQEQPSNNYAGLYPIDFCDTDNRSLFYKPVGNIAVLAGSYEPEVEATYVGGNILLDRKTEIKGSVIAGNNLKTDGDSTVNGYVSASALGEAGEINSLGNSTTIDLSGLPETYKPRDIPDMSGDTSNSCNRANSDVVKTKWTRYL